MQSADSKSANQQISHTQYAIRNTQTHEAVPAHQVLCITHLPQLAAYGDVHYHVTKHIAGERTVTQVDHLTGDKRVAELARMLGADTDAGRASVIEMMQDVETAKSAD